MPCSVAVLLAALAGAASCADLRFEEQAERWGLTAPAKRVVWGDLDGDGWLDCILDCRRVYLSRPVEGAAGARSPAAASGAPRRFVDFTEESGLLAGGEGGEGARRVAYALLGDVDNDGDLDLFSAVSQEPERWRKDPDRPEEPLLDEAGDRVPARADDGQRSAIHLNDGTGRFTRLARSGVEEPAEAALAGTFLDYDLDGVLDIFAGSSYRSYGWSYDAYPDRLYRGRGDGTFEEVTEAAGLMTRREAGHRDSSRPTFGVTSGDWNGDGFADIFVCAYGRQWNLLWRNKGDGTFTEVGESAGFDGDEVRHGHYPPGISRAPEKPFRSNGNTFDCALADFDNDGDLDLFLGEITHAWAGSSSDASALLVNQGAAEGFHFRRARDAGITRRHEIERWNQGDLHTGWIDADGDGLLDLIIASGDYPDDQRLRLFRQTPRHRFEEGTAAAGLDWEGCGGLSIGDADNDGDPDILIGRSLMRLGKKRRQELGTRPGLWINRGGDRGNWIGLELRGSGAGGCNSRGIGCRVRVRVAGRVAFHEIHGGAGHAGHQNPAELHLALGAARKADEIEIRWANAAHTVTRLEDLPAGHIIRVHEGEPAKVEILPLAEGMGSDGR